MTDTKSDTPRRCGWVPPDDPIYCDYHDTEWGVPEYDDQALFEKLILDGMQAGLSWRVILHKRDHIRDAFAGFDAETLTRWDETDIQAILDNPKVIRSRRKAEGVIKNARAYLTMAEAGISFSQYLWDYVDGAPIQNSWQSMDEVPAQTPISQALSKDLKTRGFAFCGPVIVYAFMQAVGMVNDHPVWCFRHTQLA